MIKQRKNKQFKDSFWYYKTIKIPVKLGNNYRNCQKNKFIFEIIKYSLVKLTVLILVIALNWIGLSAITETISYYNDSELSSKNLFAAGILDFELQSLSDFPDSCINNSTEKIINILNYGNFFKYKVFSSEFSGDFCDYLTLEANLDGGESEYLGPLKEFNSDIFQFSQPDDWVFKLTVNPNLPRELFGQSCNFKFIFDASQIKNNLLLGQGFFDREEIKNSIRAPFCWDSETKSLGYWKNHPTVYLPHLPQKLGGINGEDLLIKNQTEAEAVFAADNSVMRNKLRKQLLVIKFNIAHFGVGGYFVESEGKTLNEIVAMADSLLSQNPVPADSVLEEVKDILEYWNQDQKIKICSCNNQSGIVINKVYYDVGNSHGSEFDNEWVEVYNSLDTPVDISGWQICDNNSCDAIPVSSPIKAKGFAVIAGSSNTFEYWNIPDEVVKIVLNDGKIGNGLANNGDRVILKTENGIESDAMSYGSDNYAFDPPCLDIAEGHILGRFPTGFDTNTKDDWKDLELPKITLVWPNGGQVLYVGHEYSLKWNAINLNGLSSTLTIDIWYSNDSGNSWANIVRGTENDGVYDWKIPLFINDYYLPSHYARIKVVAFDSYNFMVQNWDISDSDFCPPIDYILLTEEEKSQLEQLLIDGIITESDIINKDKEMITSEAITRKEGIIEDSMMIEKNTNFPETTTTIQETTTTLINENQEEGIIDKINKKIDEAIEEIVEDILAEKSIFNELINKETVVTGKDLPVIDMSAVIEEVSEKETLTFPDFDNQPAIEKKPFILPAKNVSDDNYYNSEGGGENVSE